MIFFSFRLVVLRFFNMLVITKKSISTVKQLIPFFTHQLAQNLAVVASVLVIAGALYCLREGHNKITILLDGRFLFVGT